MKTYMKMNMTASRLMAILLLLVAVLASASYWIVRIRDSSTAAMRDVKIVAPVVTKSSGSATVALFGERPEMNPMIGNLRVTGVVIGPHPEDRIAILVDSSRARAFRIGAQIVPGVHLAEVHRRYVLVSDGKHQTRIDISERSVQAAPAPAPETARSSPASDGSLRGEPPHRSGNPDETQEPNDPAITP